MNKKISYSVILFLLIAINIAGKTKYQSKFLKYLHIKAVEKHIVSTDTNKLSIDTLSNGNIVVVYPSEKFDGGIVTEFTKDTIVTQIGINLFNHTIDDKNEFIKKFIERYLFAKIFNIPIKGFFTNEMLKVESIMDGKSIQNWSNPGIIELLKRIGKYNIDFNFDEMEVMLSDTTGHNLTLLIPRNINLLTGMDKKELDEFSLYNIINNNIQINGDYHKITNGKMLRFNDTIYYSPKKQLIKGLDQTLYFVIKGNHPQLILSADKPLMSLKNLLLNPVIKTLSLKISHSLYGQRVEKYNKDYGSLFNWLSKDAEVFAGYESSTSDSMKFLVVFYQPLLLNSHLLDISLPIDILYKNDVECRAALYTNIRVDNLNNIFKNFTENKKLMKIDLSD